MLKSVLSSPPSNVGNLYGSKRNCFTGIWQCVKLDLEYLLYLSFNCFQLEKGLSVVISWWRPVKSVTVASTKKNAVIDGILVAFRESMMQRWKAAA